MRSKSTIKNKKQSVRLLNAVDQDDEIIRLVPDTTKQVENQDYSKLKSEDTDLIESTSEAFKETKLFESNALIDKLENHQRNLDMGRGFRSKELSIEDLVSQENTIASVEEKWSQAHHFSQNPWITKLLILSVLLILFVCGWAFFNLKFGDVDLKQNNLISTELASTEDNVNHSINEQNIIKTISSFLEATTSEERLKWSRNQDKVINLMQLHYDKGQKFQSYKSIELKKVEELNLSGEDVLIVTVDAIYGDGPQTGKEETLHILLTYNGADKYLVDWSSFAIYQPSNMKSFISTKSTVPHTFRLIVVSRVEQGPYLYSFSDDRSYQAYRVTLGGDSDDYLYAYAKTGSEQGESLEKIFSAKNSFKARKIILTLAYPESAETQQCVEILKVDSEHWFIP